MPAMNDGLTRTILPADGQRSFQELREAFREANRQRIRRTLRADTLTRYHKDGTVAGTLSTGLLTDRPVGQEHRSMRDYIRAGEAVPDFDHTEEFEILGDGGLLRELDDLLRDANALRLHEGVTYPEGAITHDDGPETNQCSPLGGGQPDSSGDSAGRADDPAPPAATERPCAPALPPDAGNAALYFDGDD